MTERVLITGGTGFLGSRLALAMKGKWLVFVGRKTGSSEAGAAGCETIELDVTDIASVRRAVEIAKPTVVVHAAANKYVDQGEKDPFSCVDVNLVGSENVARVAMETDVPVVIGLSSNAATPPQVSVYGLAKAIMERMFCSLNGKSKTKFASVRLGNVAWSTGSVLPSWKAMADAAQPIEHMGADRRKFFCSADDAVTFILDTLTRIDEVAGKVVVRKLKQVRLDDLLRKFVEIHGGTSKVVEARAGDRTEEALIGELEVPYTRELSWSGVTHYLISFNEKSAKAIAGTLSATNSDAFTADELSALVASPVMQ